MAGTADEAVLARTPLGADLKAGVDQVSYEQEIVFTKYVKLVLPLDGFVFWVRGDLVLPPQPSVTSVEGSFHFATDRRQEEAETYSVNRVVFTSEDSIDFLNAIGPTTLYVGEFGGVRFSFSARGMKYRQAELWHYVGDAVYADMAPQLIDAAGDLPDPATQLITNSLPAWLSLNYFKPAWPFYPDYQPATLYPSFLTTPNIEPPWGSVHIGEDDTRAIASVPRLGRSLSHYQLAADKVRITLWGVDNDGALDFVDRVLQFSADAEVIGIMNAPIIRDAKREQRELGTLALKKVVEFEVSYIQKRIVDYTRQYLTSVIVGVYPNPSPTYNQWKFEFPAVAGGAVVGSPSVQDASAAIGGAATVQSPSVQPAGSAIGGGADLSTTIAQAAAASAYIGGSASVAAP